MRGVADAISVLTDGPYFGGSLDDLATVRAVFDGPILAKDFIVDPRQVAEARRTGADAVLVISRCSTMTEARAVMAEAARLGMDVLVEAHDEAELERAVALGAPIIGINNRDLRTLEIDLAVTERLGGLVPDDRLVVAESGIRDRAMSSGWRLMPTPSWSALADARRTTRPGGAGARLRAGEGLRHSPSRRMRTLPRRRWGDACRPDLCRGQAPRVAGHARGDCRAGRQSGLQAVGVFRDQEAGGRRRTAHDARPRRGPAPRATRMRSGSRLRSAASRRPRSGPPARSARRSSPSATGADRILFDTR